MRKKLKPKPQSGIKKKLIPKPRSVVKKRIGSNLLVQAKTTNINDLQYALRKGANWDDFSFKERTCKGWLSPYLFQLDNMFSSRWEYWIQVLTAGSCRGKAIPQIDFFEQPSHEVLKNLKDCLENYACHDVKLPDFFEWLLWGFGEGEERAKISDEVNEHWYRTFNLGLLLKYPYDYLGDMLGESKAGRSYWTNPNGFYATPHSIVKMMTDMTIQRKKGVNLMLKSVCDLCVGTGRFLMYASNYSLSLYGQDVDNVCCMACKINGYLYVPWLVKSGKGRVEGLK